MIDALNSVTYTKQNAVEKPVQKEEAVTPPAETTEQTQTTKPSGQDTFSVSYDGKVYTSGAELVEKLKAEQIENQTRFLQTVKNSVLNQAKENSLDGGLWKFIASGDYNVDAATQKAAQEAISEDGYWGVEQTAQRLVTFAKGLTGGDPSKIEEMKDAFIKGFEAALGEWGKEELPDISNQTYERVMELFDEWEQGSSGVAAQTGAEIQ